MSVQMHFTGSNRQLSFLIETLTCRNAFFYLVNVFRLRKNVPVMTDTITRQVFPKREALQLSLQTLLTKVISLDGADMGNIQLYDDESESLFMIIHQNLDEKFLDSFYIIKPFGAPSCGRAIGLGIPITIDDVSRDASLRPVLDLLKFRAVRSIPVLDYDRTKLGVISTHSLRAGHSFSVDHSHPLIKEIAVTLKAIRSEGFDWSSRL